VKKAFEENPEIMRRQSKLAGKLIKIIGGIFLCILLLWTAVFASEVSDRMKQDGRPPNLHTISRKTSDASDSASVVQRGLGESTRYRRRPCVRGNANP
jgi:hypothetical protein